MAPRLKYKNIEFLKKLGNSDKPSLTNINKVLEILNNPHKKNMGIKIAISGTNGKGSVAKSLSEILNKSKYRVGLYTSPHIFDINERIQINNKKISIKEFKPGKVLPSKNEETSILKFKQEFQKLIK